MNFLRLFFFVIFVNLALSAQESNTKKFRFIFQLDNRFSSIDKADIVLWGAKTGVQYKNYTRFGLGASFITSPVQIDYFNKRTRQNEINTIDFHYISFFDDLILYKNPKWEIFLTEQLCYGSPSFSKEVNDEIVSDVDIKMFLNEFSGQVNYKIFPWIGTGVGIGYRNVWNKSPLLQRTFNAPVYIVKIIIYPMAIFKNQTQNQQ